MGSFHVFSSCGGSFNKEEFYDPLGEVKGKFFFRQYPRHGRSGGVSILQGIDILPICLKEDVICPYDPWSHDGAISVQPDPRPLEIHDRIRFCTVKFFKDIPRDMKIGRFMWIVFFHKAQRYLLYIFQVHEDIPPFSIYVWK